jgi:three-Cys-motif partner protein
MAGGRFTGGRHTQEKLSILQEYLRFYAKALKNQGFSLIYIDAFAGNGDYELDLGDAGLFAGSSGEVGVVTRPGSAKLALSIQPPFTEVIFIDNDPASIRSLEQIRSENPSRNIRVVPGDANEAVRQLCSRTAWHERRGDRKGIRAVLFLDPFNMAVDWETLVAIGRTEAIDLWYLFPTNAVGRQLAHDPTKIDLDKVNALNRVLGGDWWRQELYVERPPDPSLFDFAEHRGGMVREARLDQIAQEFIKKLETHFGRVAPAPRHLRQRNLLKFSLIFAVANRRRGACDLAMRGANHILKADLSLSG